MLRHSIPLGLTIVSSSLVASPVLAQDSDGPEKRRSAARPVHVLFDDVVGLHAASTSLGDPFGLSQSGVISYTTTSTPTQRATSWAVSPAIDVPISDRITLGGRLRAARTLLHSEQPQAPPFGIQGWSFSVLPRVGYLHPLNDTLSIWTRVGVGYGRGESSTDGGAVGGIGVPNGISPLVGPIGVSHEWTGSVDVSLSARLLDHLLVSVGPELALQYAERGANVSTTTLRAGARASLGMVF